MVLPAVARIVTLDNVSHIPPWLSDALCRAVTGNAFTKRRLYTDGDLAVISLQRAIILTSIDPGALQGDLAERLLPIELETIPDHRRLRHRDLTEQFDKVRPAIFAGLLDLVANVLRVLPDLHLDTAPRMADFAHIVAAVDTVTGSHAYDHYLAVTRDTASTVPASDPFATTVVELVEENGGQWIGTTTELLDEATRRQERPGRDWPATVQAATAALRRIAPALRHQGITIEHHRTGPQPHTPVPSRSAGNLVILVTTSQIHTGQRPRR